MSLRNANICRKRKKKQKSIKVAAEIISFEKTGKANILHNMTSSIIEDKRNMNAVRSLPRIVLIACGSFSPPTPVHFRMFEIAKDHFEKNCLGQVVGGIVSPTHDSYGKKGLALGKHRLAMVKLALQTSNWIRLSDWEVVQEKWSRTIAVLQYHKNCLNNYMNSSKSDDDFPSWLPLGLRDCEGDGNVELRLLCGADLLESFAEPGLWSDEDIDDIVGTFGLVVITRSGANPEKFVFESNMLTKLQSNITLITNWVPNEVSSTLIRRLLSRGNSVRYLIDDKVVEYIKMHGLYSGKNFALDNRKSNVFCCGGDGDSIVNKLLSNRAGRPGQAVQVITTERGNTVTRLVEDDDDDETQAKKMKTAAAAVQDV